MTDIGTSEGDGSPEHNRDLSARFGVGADIYVTEHFSIGAKGTYVLTTDASGDLDWADHASFTLGGQFRF